MNTYNTEEEQLEALKRWWHENGATTVISVVLAISSVVGYQSWQSSQQAAREAGTVAYQELLQAVSIADSEGTDIAIATASHLATELKDQQAGSAYSHFAAFYKARQLVRDGDLASAETELRWVLDSGPSHEVFLTAQLRLARVLFAQQRVDEALVLLDETDTGAFAPSYLEVKGDILMSSEQYAEAVAAYQTALDAAVALGMTPPQTLPGKLSFASGYL